MADDLDLADLAKDWQQQRTPADSAVSSADLIQARQRQHRQRLLMYGEWLGALVMATTACWLVFAVPNWIGFLGAAFLTIGALGALYVNWRVHRPILAYDFWETASLLLFRYRTGVLTLRYYRYLQLSCAGLLLFTALLWVLRWWQPSATSMDLLLFYSLVASPVCLFAIYRLQHRVKSKAVELRQLKVLLDEFQSS